MYEPIKQTNWKKCATKLQRLRICALVVGPLKLILCLPLKFVRLYDDSSWRCEWIHLTKFISLRATMENKWPALLQCYTSVKTWISTHLLPVLVFSVVFSFMHISGLNCCEIWYLQLCLSFYAYWYGLINYCHIRALEYILIPFPFIYEPQF